MDPNKPNKTDIKDGDEDLKLEEQDSTVILKPDASTPASNVNTLGDTKDHEPGQAREQSGKKDKLLNATIAGHYQIIDFIGLGGMGKVYRAYHTLLKRQVAIKFLQDNIIGHDEATLRRFQQEAQTVIKLNHANIPALREFGVAENTPFIVMDFAEGESLSKLIVQKALTAEELCVVAEQICDALEHAHQNKIIHRDIKPSNILVKRNQSADSSGQSVGADAKSKTSITAYLLDFGISKVLDSIADSRLTQTGELVGTVRYMSPEQFNGFPASPSSDIYSLGCVLFEAFAGRPPFMGNNRMEIIRQHQEDEPPDLPASVPSHIQNIIYRCLEKSPERRYSSAAELKAEMHKAATGQSPDFLVPRIKTAQYKWFLTIIFTLPCILGLIWLLNLPKEEAGFERLNQEINAAPDNPESAKLYFARGEKYFHNKSYQQALYDYTHAAKLDPKNTKAMYKAATCFYETGDHQSAIKYANQALEIDPREDEAMFIAAAAKAKLGRLVEAVEDYSKLLNSLPETLSSLRLAALNNRSNAYFVMGKNEAALADTKAVLKLQPENKGAQLNRAEIMISLRDYEKAFDDVNSVLKADPKSDRAHDLRGRINLLTKRHEKAVDDFTDAINLGRKNPAIFLDRARAHMGLANHESALNDSKQAGSLEPSNPIPKFYHAYFLCKAGKVEESLIETDALLSIYKRDADLWLLKAAALAKQGKKDEAQKIVSSIESRVSDVKKPMKVNAEFLAFARESLK